MDPIQFVWGFPFFFVGFWLFVVALISILGGWYQLGKKYAAPDSFLGDCKGWQSGRIGLSSYNSCLWIGTDLKGLYLKTGPLLLFRFLHPPLFIPWHAFTEVKPYNLLWQSYVLLKVAGCRVTLVLPKKLFEIAVRYPEASNFLKQLNRQSAMIDKR
jgi:hypothetical protein